MFARGDAETRAVAAVVPAGYNSALSRLKGTEETPDVAAKKPAKKAAKAAPKKASAPVKKAVAKKPVAAKKTAAKPAAKKVVAKKPAPAKKAVPAKKPVAKPAAKTVPAKTVAKAPVKAPAKAAPAKAPAKAAAPAKKPAPPKAPVAKPASKAIGREGLVGPVKVETPKQPQSTHAGAPAPKPAAKPVAKPVAKELAQATPTKPVAASARPVGKVAVAVAARPQQPAANRKLKVVPYDTDEATGRPILPKGYRPSPDEEYMGALQLEYFRQRLLQWRADLIEESKQTIENLKDEVRDVGDEAERATRETENSLELRTRDRYRKLIGKIDSTLKRVDAGEYGYSVDSGEEIGLERLEARLTAERTIDEQERWEHLQKQIGD
ncbi:MAG: RNA polymerase-binding protein DksA [Lysobacter sp.]|nr:RNA polymerase-binding protein DksA [Lysobacter sp.]